jgi:hypothetical protein
VSAFGSARNDGVAFFAFLIRFVLAIGAQCAL